MQDIQAEKMLRRRRQRCNKGCERNKKASGGESVFFNDVAPIGQVTSKTRVVRKHKLDPTDWKKGKKEKKLEEGWVE